MQATATPKLGVVLWKNMAAQSHMVYTCEVCLTECKKQAKNPSSARIGLFSLCTRDCLQFAFDMCHTGISTCLWDSYEVCGADASVAHVKCKL